MSVPGKPWRLLKKVFPLTFINKALRFSEKSEDKNLFQATHALNPGDLGRILLDASTDHLADLRVHGELTDFYVGKDSRSVARHIATKFRECVAIATEGAEIELPIESVEILKSNAGSEGTCRHMDQLEGVYNVIAPLNKSEFTSLADYVYETYPQYMGSRSNIPTDWDGLSQVTISWEVGDALIMPADHIHWAPHNNTNHTRFLVFGAGQAKMTGFSDSEVITESVFAYRRRAFQFAQETRFLRNWTNTHIHNTHRRGTMNTTGDATVAGTPETPPEDLPGATAPDVIAADDAKDASADDTADPDETPGPAKSGKDTAVKSKRRSTLQVTPSGEAKRDGLPKRIVDVIFKLGRSLPKDIADLGGQNAAEGAQIWVPFIAKLASDFRSTPSVDNMRPDPLRYLQFVTTRWQGSPVATAKDFLDNLEEKWFQMSRARNEHEMNEEDAELFGLWLAESGLCQRFFLELEEDEEKREKLARQQQEAEDTVVALELQIEVPHTTIATQRAPKGHHMPPHAPTYPHMLSNAPKCSRMPPKDPK
jgi:hypothetical protein